MSRARDVASLLNTVATDEELTSGLSEKLSYEFASASPTASASGFLWYDSNSSPAAPKFWDGSAFQALTSGKILQVVRATDSTERCTNATSFGDITGLSVTITPQKSDSAILLICSLAVEATRSDAFDDCRSYFAITDSSNNTVSGASFMRAGTENLTGSGTLTVQDSVTMFAYSTPATTSATTYKARFRSTSTNMTVCAKNAQNDAQLYAIEVSA